MEKLSSTASIIIALVIVSELVISLIAARKSYDVKDSLANLTIGISGGILSKLLWHSLMVAAFVACFAISPFELSSSSWWYWPLALLLSDFSYYWYHRSGHEVRFLWGTHSVHHSSEDYNLSTAVRLSWLENSFRWVFWMPLPLLGYDPISSMIAYLLIRYYQVWLHSGDIKRVPYFEKIFTTPSHHRVHHGTNPQYIDKNYAGCLTIWDRVFGTYQEEEEAVVYGVLKPINTYNPFKINFGEYISLAKDIWHEPSFRNKLQLAIRKPGWSPQGGGPSLEEMFEEKLSMGYGRNT